LRPVGDAHQRWGWRDDRVRHALECNPVNLQRPDSPSVVTYRQLQSDPETSGDDAEVLPPSLQKPMKRRNAWLNCRKFRRL